MAPILRALTHSQSNGMHVPNPPAAHRPEPEHRTAEERLRARQDALAALSSIEAFRRGDRKRAFRAITETAADVLDVARVGIWLFDDTHTSIRCADLWERDAQRHSAGTTLSAQEFADYFAALQEHRTIAVYDVHADPRTAEFSESYLTEFGIGAMLDAPIRVGGRTIGVVCHEHVGGVRRWLPEDELFVGSIADYAALAVEASERLRTEEALRTSEASYRALVDHALVGIYRSTIDGRFLAVNPALVAMLGYDSIEEVLDLDVTRDVYADPAERHMLVEAYQASERIEGLEAHWRKKDGSALTVRLFGRPLRDSDDCVFGFEMTVEDFTERRALEAQLRQAQKMEAVGQLSGGIAHDFNNILTVIMATADLIKHSLHEDQLELACDVDELQAAAKRGTELVKHLLGFSRQTQIEQRPTDLGSVVQPLSKTLQRLLPEDIEIRVITPEHTPIVRVDPGTIEQMVLNAATNARDAMSGGGVLTIEVRDTWIDEEHRARHGWGQPGHYVSIIVSDTGKGMDEQTVQRAFEPFFTTKPTGVGTGLGMAMIYGLVKQQDGFVDLRSAPGRGTTLQMYFPVIGEDAEHHRDREQAAVRAARPATILLVEDDHAVASVTTRVLEHAGYRVLLVGNGQEALGRFAENERDISLVITDMVMPVMGGRELFETLRSQDANVQFLFVSGYAAERAQLDPEIPFLHKPWTVTDLLFTIHKLLSEQVT